MEMRGGFRGRGERRQGEPMLLLADQAHHRLCHALPEAGPDDSLRTVQAPMAFAG